MKKYNELTTPGDTSPEFLAWCLELHDVAGRLVYEGDTEARRIKSQGWARHKSKGDPRLYEARDAARVVWSEIAAMLKAAGLYKAFQELKEAARAKDAREYALRYDLQSAYYRTLPAEVSLDALGRLNALRPELRPAVARALETALFELKYSLNEAELQELTAVLKPYEIRCEICKCLNESRYMTGNRCQDCTEKEQES